MKRLQVLGALCLAIGAVLVSAASASAAPGDPFQFKYSFDGSQLPSGLPFVQSMAVNHQSGNILVSDGAQGTIDQFDSEGNPANFAATGSPQISLGRAGYIVVNNNTSGPGQGNFYVFAGEVFGAYHADGSPIPGFEGAMHWPSGEGIGGSSCGGGIAPDGNIWFTSIDSEGASVLELTPDGLPTGKQIHLVFSGGLHVNEGACSPVFDSHGDVYLGDSGNPLSSIHKFEWENGFPDLGETGLSGNVSTGSYGEVAVDPSTDDLYIDEASKVSGVHYSDPLVKSTPFEALKGLTASRGIAFDSTGQTLYASEGGTKIDVFHREPPTAPWGLGQLSIEDIRSDGAEVHGQLTAGGDGQADYHFEYGTTSAYGTSTPEVHDPNFFPVKVGFHMVGLQADTTYHVRLVATNSIGTTYGPDRVIRTYPLPPGVDTCPNTLARKQTIAQRLPDCRGYELASASDTGGYDVESYLAPGQTPFPGFPMATDKLLYATHAGAVPGPWNATNKGLDPYVATRTSSGWVTEYEGLPANLNATAGSFSSVLGEADQSLNTLAFAGANLCSPCFGSGLETGIPVRLSSGQLVQGMSGSVNPGTASARPEGKVTRYFSENGKKLLFASKYVFEPGANNNGSGLTVYEHDLAAGTTEIVSTDPSGVALTGVISELDVSSDGSRVVLGKRVSLDSQGNEYVHPYLHIAGRPGSIDLAPGASTGVLYAGMTSDGSRVFFTTADKLDGSDTDTSADLYEADVDPAGNLALTKVTPESSNACDPVANANGEHWNTTGGAANCAAVAISGGGGVASNTGAVYFLSPEQFGGEGTLNQPNLYLTTPAGSPTFIATLEPNNPLVLDAVKAAAVRKTGDFQTTPSGGYAAFVSDQELTGVHTFGFLQAFRYGAGSAQLLCASCDKTGTSDDSLAGDAELAPNGLSLLEDGRLFFTSRFPLALNDTNGRKDVYEWSNGEGQLISAGTGPFDSALLTASAAGTDAFFFTHDSLAPGEDHNGQLVKIYDAREGGGFFKLPASVPCQASDECHGPGTAAPGPPDIKSSGKTTQGNVVVCAKNRVKHRGQCVKKKHAKKRKGGAKKRAAKTNGKRGGRNA